MAAIEFFNIFCDAEDVVAPRNNAEFKTFNEMAKAIGLDTNTSTDPHQWMYRHLDQDSLYGWASVGDATKITFTAKGIFDEVSMYLSCGGGSISFSFDEETGKWVAKAISCPAGCVVLEGTSKGGDPSRLIEGVPPSLRETVMSLVKRDDLEGETESSVLKIREVLSIGARPGSRW